MEATEDHPAPTLTAPSLSKTLPGIGTGKEKLNNLKKTEAGSRRKHRSRCGARSYLYSRSNQLYRSFHDFGRFYCGPHYPCLRLLPISAGERPARGFRHPRVRTGARMTGVGAMDGRARHSTWACCSWALCCWCLRRSVQSRLLAELLRGALACAFAALGHATAWPRPAICLRTRRRPDCRSLSCGRRRRENSEEQRSRGHGRSRSSPSA